MTYVKSHSHYWQLGNSSVTKRIARYIHLSDSHCSHTHHNDADKTPFQSCRSRIPSLLWKPLWGILMSVPCLKVTIGKRHDAAMDRYRVCCILCM